MSLPFSRVAMALSISFTTRLVCFFVSMAGIARDNTNSLIRICMVRGRGKGKGGTESGIVCRLMLAYLSQK